MPHQFDVYGHRLIDTRDEKLERRINRLAAKLAHLATDEGMTDRARAVRTELYACCTRYFRVVGQGIDNGGDSFDGLLLDLMMDGTAYEELDGRTRFNPEKGPFTNYVRYLFKKRRHSEGKAEERIFPLEPIDDSEGESIDSNPAISTSDDVLDQCQAEEMLVEMLVLAMHLKEAVDQESKRSDNVAGAGRHMVFTETVTYLVKSEETQSAEYLARHERDTFKAMEGHFLDMFMEQICRTFPDIWLTPILKQYKARNNWPPLKPDAYIDYLLESYKKRITNARVSQFRKEFRDLVVQLPAFAALSAEAE